MVAEDGRIELWDLKNNIEPRLSWWDKQEGTNAPIKVAKTCVRWSRASPVIVTGNTQGVVDVYRHFGLQHV